MTLEASQPTIETTNTAVVDGSMAMSTKEAEQKKNEGSLEFHDPRDLSPLSIKHSEDQGNYRRKRPQPDLDELSDDIVAKGGILQSIVIRQTAENGLEVVAGYGRWECALNLWDKYGFKVPCLNKGYISDREAIEIAISENLKRTDVTIGDLSVAARRYLSLSDGDHATAAMKLGMGEKTYREYLQISNCVPELIDALDDNEQPVLKGHCLILSQFPLEIQQNTLKSILNDPKTYTVQYLKAKAKSFEFKLCDARFDTEKAGCNDCQYNSQQQFTMLLDGEDDARCSNAHCYLDKQNQWLNEVKIPDLKVEYGTVLTTEQKPISDVRSVTDEALGSDQVKKCSNCESCAVLVVSNIGDTFGMHKSNCCIDLDCYTEQQKAFAKSQEPEPKVDAKPDAQKTSVDDMVGNTDTGTTDQASTATQAKKKVAKVAKAPAAPAPKLSKKTERTYANMIQKMAGGFVSAQLSEQFALAAMIKGLSNSLRFENQIKEDIPTLALMESEQLKGMLQQLLGSFMAQDVPLDSESTDRSDFDANKVLRTIMTKSLGEDDIRERAIASWVPNTDIWKLHTKAQIIIICDDSGFQAAYDKVKGSAAWAKMMSKPVGDIYKALESFEFDWSDYAPEAYIDMAINYKKCS
ncbi:ParB/RepB/Spo0J family partition protein [Vibrio coralliilyticus]|uniref:ParB/RepB/Spo0J family partition protein n=1 Tax=Vibrio coralliilyticus TaxID=190893 RepID=UPI0015CA67F9|nr:ParB N-terminal domain-containing protein [Vibrio coralliilyticus]